MKNGTDLFLFMQSIDRKYLQMLVNTTYFADYVEHIITQDRIFLHHEVVNKFLKIFVPLVCNSL